VRCSVSRAALVLAWLAIAPAVVAQQFNAPVETKVATAPAPVLGVDGLMHVAYEVHVTNFYPANGPLLLTELDVYAEGSETPVASYSGQDLLRLVKAPTERPSQGISVPAGSRTVLFLWISWADGMMPVRGLWHRMYFKDARDQPRILQGLNVSLTRQSPIVIAPPLRGSCFWLASEGPGNARSHHWSSLLALNGVVTIPQRYAIDFVGLNARGHALELPQTTQGGSTNADWFGYDAEVLAVADGVVRDARDGEEDGRPMTPHAESTELTARGLYGNFIVLEIAPDVFVHYAHLRRGSVGVHTGQHVRSGEVLARVGDSGNSALPHLHFHLSNRPVFEESEGLPFRFSRFTVQGTADEKVVLSSDSAWTPHPVEWQDAIPLDCAVLSFHSE